MNIAIRLATTLPTAQVVGVCNAFPKAEATQSGTDRSEQLSNFSGKIGTSKFWRQLEACVTASGGTFCDEAGHIARNTCSQRNKKKVMASERRQHFEEKLPISYLTRMPEDAAAKFPQVTEIDRN